jgi:hypothetical protein
VVKCLPLFNLDGFFFFAGERAKITCVFYDHFHSGDIPSFPMAASIRRELSFKQTPK